MADRWQPNGSSDDLRKGKRNDMDDTLFLNILKTTAENHGCTIADVDLENHVINLDGPDDAVATCALAISKLVGD